MPQDGSIPSTIERYVTGGNPSMLIDGAFVPAASGETFDTLNPATQQLLARLPAADATDVDRAVVAARRAFDDGPWSTMKPFDRQRIMLRFADLVEARHDDLATLDTLDMGAPIQRMRANLRRAVGMARFYAGLTTALRGETIANSIPGDFLTHTRREPVGVVGAIIPWNNPHIAFIWKVGAALAAGCTVVLKPAEEASLSALWLGEMLLEAGLPAGVVNVVTGFGETAGVALSVHPGVDKIAFTGSTATGQAIVRAASTTLKRVTLELGGKSPNIVFNDADLDLAVPGAAMAAFTNSGQVCSAGTRLFVERGIYEEFVGAMTTYARSLTVGDGLDDATQLGPVVSQTQLERVSDYFEIGRAEGATISAGGARLLDGQYANGYFVPPTIFTEVNNEMRVAREEIFGPVVSVMAFDDYESVIRLANSSPFGLGGGVWTNDVNKANRTVSALRTGTVWVNCYGQMDPAVPFGGYRMSGYGREGGVHHIDEFLETKAVWIQTH